MLAFSLSSLSFSPESVAEWMRPPPRANAVLSQVVMPRMDPTRAILEPGTACGNQRFFETVSETNAEIFYLISWYTLMWGALWLACGHVCKWVLCPLLPASSSFFENHHMYVGQKLVAALKCALVSAIANFGLHALWTREPWSREIEFGGYPLAEVAGVLFTSFETADLILCVFYRFLDLEHVRVPRHRGPRWRHNSATGLPCGLGHTSACVLLDVLSCQSLPSSMGDSGAASLHPYHLGHLDPRPLRARIHHAHSHGAGHEVSCQKLSCRPYALCVCGYACGALPPTQH